jgi:hypothetical protein
MVLNYKVVATLAVVLMAASGCGNEELGNKCVNAAATAPDAVQQSAPSPSETSLAYYEANLEKTKSVWVECRKTGPDNMTESQIKNCANAQQAWEFQPYKPKPATFSSSGGRH